MKFKRNIRSVSYTHLDVYKRQQFQLCLQFLLNIYRVRFRVLVSTHEFQSRKQYGLHTAFLQVEVDHSRRNKLSLDVYKRQP